MKSGHFSWRSGATRPKVWYANDLAAIEAAKRLGTVYMLTMEAYKCDGCTGWHIGEQRTYRANQAGLTKLFADYVACWLRGKDMPLTEIIQRKRAQFEATHG